MVVYHRFVFTPSRFLHILSYKVPLFLSVARSRHFTVSKLPTSYPSPIVTVPTGVLGERDFVLRFYQQQPNDYQGIMQNKFPFRWVSPWHHIPLFTHLVSSLGNNNQVDLDTILSSDYMLSSSLAEEALSQPAPFFQYPLSSMIQNEYTLKQVHDLLSPNNEDAPIVNMVVEIPKGTLEKLEIDTSSRGNPIKQNLNKDNSLRTLKEPMQWNYGAIPQTWENPCAFTGFFCRGDNDPLDIVEIGNSPIPLGSVIPVRVLGCLALIDQGELDWKIIAIREQEPSLGIMPYNDEYQKIKMAAVREWFRTYKISDGKPRNTFLFEDQILPPDVALLVITEGHLRWRELVIKNIKPNNNDMSAPTGAATSLWYPKLTVI